MRQAAPTVSRLSKMYFHPLLHKEAAIFYYYFLFQVFHWADVTVSLLFAKFVYYLCNLFPPVPSGTANPLK